MTTIKKAPRLLCKSVDFYLLSRDLEAFMPLISWDLENTKLMTLLKISQNQNVSWGVRPWNFNIRVPWPPQTYKDTHVTLWLYWHTANCHHSKHRSRLFAILTIPSKITWNTLSYVLNLGSNSSAAANSDAPHLLQWLDRPCILIEDV